MRLWSIHPKYLDCKGLVALWREALLAKRVLQGRTRGYRNHPQLDRFKQTSSPRMAINTYLYHVWKESKSRCYNFDKSKIGRKADEISIKVSRGQIEYEFKILKSRLRTRDKSKYRELLKVKRPQAHPIFKTVNGPVEDWERQT